MIIEYSVEDLKTHYNNLHDDNVDKYADLEDIVSNNIDNNNVNSEILHIFPIFIAIFSYTIGFSYLLL